MSSIIDPATGEPVQDKQIHMPAISKAGPGATIVAVGVLGSEVVLQVPHPVAWIALDPQTAVNVGESMARAAYKVRHGREPRPNVDALAEEIKRKTTDHLRQVLITRGTLILRQLLERGRSPEYIATEIIDRCLQEVT